MSASLRARRGPASRGAPGRVRSCFPPVPPERGPTGRPRLRIDGPVLAEQAAVAVKQAVAFDVTPAVVGAGTYSFALESSARDAFWYQSRQARSGRPELRVVLVTPEPKPEPEPEPKPEVPGVEDLGFGPAVESA